MKKKLDTSDIINIIIASAAIAALVFSSITYTSGLKREALVGRPIISIPLIKFTYDTLPKFIIVPAYTIQNYGSRPAYDLNLLVITLQKESSSDSFTFLDSMKISMANPMITGVLVVLNSSPINAQNNQDYYFKIAFDYKDVISDKHYTDNFYFKYSYKDFDLFIHNNQVFGLTIEEKNSVNNFLLAKS